MSNTDNIKSHLRIEEVIASYLKLEPAGGNFKAKCPFHNERTASFFVSPDRGTFYCFGCGAKGDMFDFVSQYEGLDFVGALRLLADKAGIKLDNNHDKVSDNSDLFQTNRDAAIYFHRNLEKNKDALEYLKNRGLSEDTIKSWGLGYAPAEWRNLVNYLSTQKKYSLDTIIKAGLAIKKDNSTPFDRFRGRIMFPLFDASKRIVGFTGRIYPHNDDDAKYLNSPETPIFQKSHYLYGLHEARNHARTSKTMLVVEGQMDLLASYEAGVGNTVAVSGTAFGEHHAKLIQRYADEVIFAYDEDKAGTQALMRSIESSYKAGIRPRAIPISGAKDPSIIVLENKDAWPRLVSNSEDAISHLVQRIKKEASNSGALRDSVKKYIFPLVSLVESKMERSECIKVIAASVDSTQTAVMDDFNAYIRLQKPESEKAPKVFSNTQRSNIDKILLLYIWQIESKKPKIDIQSMKDAVTKIIGENIFGQKYDELKSELDASLTVAEFLFGSEDIEKSVSGLLSLVEEDKLREKMVILLSKIQKTEKTSPPSEVEKLLQEYKDLSASLATLSKKRNI